MKRYYRKTLMYKKFEICFIENNFYINKIYLYINRHIIVFATVIIMYQILFRIVLYICVCRN